ncbi:hypothetical protein [uncultured Haemophilus sp.]|jgi:hypothetical protein|uniref:hypothetical protein n=1 Tax=uncultured Haemophilus sp. TaxID=237779 RepID=UPI0025CF213C|nr:hypothetical protein [uncultured Haemophilus sp.]
MELLPLDFYSLTQAIDFINQKTNSSIKENSLYSYAIEEKIRFLLKIEIKDNQLIKIGRNDTEGFFISKDSELFFRGTALKDEKEDSLSLSDKFSFLEIDKKEPLKADNDDLFLSLDNSKVNSFKGYIVLHPELLDLFCRDSLPQHSLKNTNYLALNEFTLQTLDDSDIFSSFNFVLNYPLYDEDERLYIKHTFRINFSDIKIFYDDLIKLAPSNNSLTCNDLEQEIKNLKLELEEKQKIIDSLSLTNPKGRISSPQKQLFALLVKRCYSDIKSRNKLFDVINADLKSLEIRNADISADTFYKLIDESNDIIKAIFPPKKS